MTISSMPDAIASSTTTWIAGVSITGKISLGITLDDGNMRVPMPAARMTAFLTFILIRFFGICARLAFQLASFLRRFASDAERGDRPGFQPLDADFAAALLAVAVR